MWRIIPTRTISQESWIELLAWYTSLKIRKKVLDANGENSIKIRIPENWDPLTGDIFVRLTTHGWNVRTP